MINKISPNGLWYYLYFTPVAKAYIPIGPVVIDDIRTEGLEFDHMQPIVLLHKQKRTVREEVAS